MLMFFNPFFHCQNASKYNDEPTFELDSFHKIKKEFFVENGKLASIYKVNLNGKIDGICYDYHLNGRMKRISFFKDGIIDSLQSWYYLTGVKQADLFYLNGRHFGSQYLYDSLDKLEQVYFVSSVNDSCISSIVNLNQNGSIKKIIGGLITTIFRSDTLNKQDSAVVIFYVTVPPFYDIKTTIIEKKIGNYIKREPCELNIMSNNLGYMYYKKLDSVGEYDVGLHITINNSKMRSTFSDSTFIPLIVK